MVHHEIQRAVTLYASICMLAPCHCRTRARIATSYQLMYLVIVLTACDTSASTSLLYWLPIQSCVQSF